MAAGWQDATKLISLVTREKRRKGQGKIFQGPISCSSLSEGISMLAWMNQCPLSGA